MSETNQFSLLKTRNFLPLFVTQAIGAFNDNALRNGIAILMIFEVLAGDKDASLQTLLAVMDSVRAALGHHHGAVDPHDVVPAQDLLGPVEELREASPRPLE